jgi:hypothetical protein
MIVKWFQLSALAGALVLAGGCGGGGGGSGSSSAGGVAAQNPDPVAISSVQTGTPICSTAGNGSLNGPTTAGTVATVALSPSCSDPTATMRVWLGVNSPDTNITHYDWEIVGWRNTTPHGGLDKYDEVVDLDPINGRYIVRTYGVNAIRYVSATSAQLAAMTSAFSQQITVTAWTADGRFGTASFTVTVQPGGTAVSSVYGSLASTDAASHARAGHRSDFYRITGAGTTTLSTEGFDTVLYVYNSARNLVAEKDEGGVNGGSQLTVSLQSGQTYYIEVTSFQPGQTGGYRLSSTTGGLTATADPWAGVSAPNIAGTYTVTENTTITIVYKGVTTTTNAVTSRTATVTQSGPSFSFQATDPTGMLPAATRYGTLNGNSIQLNGEPFIPGNPAITVTTNTQTSVGTVGGNTLSITNTAQLTGTYKGLPLTAQLNSRATFSR